MSRRTGRIAPAWWVLAALSALTVLLTYPYARHLNTAAVDIVDPLLNSWILAWDKHALLGGPDALAGYWHGNIFFPYRYTLAFSEHLLGVAAFDLPWLLAIPSPLGGLNAYILQTYVLTGLAVWLLVSHWTRSRRAGFFAALIFAFMPARLMTVGQPNISTMQWVLFSLFFMHRWLEKKQTRDWLLALLFVNLGTFSTVNHTMNLALMHAIMLAAWLAFRRRAFDLRSVGMLALMGAVTAGLNYPLWRVYVDVGNTLRIERTLGDVYIGSADAAYYVMSMPTNWLYGRFFPSVMQHAHLPVAFFVGATAYAAALVGLAALFRRGDSGSRVVLATLVGWAMFGFGMSLGVNDNAFGPRLAPYLRYLLPYRLLYDVVPMLKGSRVPARFAMLYFAGLVGLAGFGMAFLLRLLEKRRRLSDALAAAACLVVVAELISVPLSVRQFPYGDAIPPVYHSLDEIGEDDVLVELPYYYGQRRGGYEALREYYSTYHYRRLVNGSSGYNPRPLQQIGQVLVLFPEWQSIELLGRLGADYALLHSAEFDSFYEPGRWDKLWSEVYDFLPAFSEVRQVGDAYLLRLEQPACTVDAGSMLPFVGLRAGEGVVEEEDGEGSESDEGTWYGVVALRNTSSAGFYSDPNTPGTLSVEWLRGDSKMVVGREEVQFNLPPVILPGLTGEAAAALSPPPGDAPTAVRLSARIPGIEAEAAREVSLEEFPRIPADVPEGREVDSVPGDALLAEPVRFEDGVEAVGYVPGPPEVSACGVAAYTFYWKVPVTESGREEVWLVLVDRYGRKAVVEKTRPWWRVMAGRIVEDTHYLPAASSLPPGVYDVRLKLTRPPEDEPIRPLESNTESSREISVGSLVVRPAPLDLSTGGWQNMDAVLGGAFRLRAALPPPDGGGFHAGDWLLFSLAWEAVGEGREEDAVVFTQLIGPGEDGLLWGQHDAPPTRGWYAPSTWRDGEVVADRHLLRISPDAPPGRYKLVAGMYRPDTKERLPVANAEGVVLGDYVVLGEIVVAGE